MNGTEKLEEKKLEGASGGVGRIYSGWMVVCSSCGLIWESAADEQDARYMCNSYNTYLHCTCGNSVWTVRYEE